MCLTDQRTQYLLSSSIPLTQTGSTSRHTHTHTHTHTRTHTHTQSHTFSHIHTASHTLTHYSHTTHTPSLTIHTLHTPSYITCTLLTHFTNTYTLHTLTHTISSHTHTPSHTHTLTHSSPAHIHTHTHNHRAYRSEDTGNLGSQGSAHIPGMCSMWEQPRVPAEVSHWNFHKLRNAELPENKGDNGGTYADPPQSRSNLTALKSAAMTHGPPIGEGAEFTSAWFFFGQKC